MEKSLGILLKYHDYPESIRRSIHSTNLIERMNKEIRRRIKIVDSLPSEESAIKIIYLRSAEINEQWSLMCSLYHLDSYKREYIELMRYKGESRGGFANLLHHPHGTGDAHA